MIKSRSIQEIGSNEATKEEQKQNREGRRSGKTREQRAEDIAVHMPTMSHNGAESEM